MYCGAAADIQQVTDQAIVIIRAPVQYSEHGARSDFLFFYEIGNVQIETDVRALSEKIDT